MENGQWKESCSKKSDNSNIKEENSDRKGWGHLAREAGESTPVEIVVQESAGMSNIISRKKVEQRPIEILSKLG